MSYLSSILSSALLASLTSAQQLLVVDRAGGAGSQFLAIRPAIAAAQPGDTVLVRAGLYQEHLSIDKGIRLVGMPGAQLDFFTIDGTVLVHDLPAGQTFSMRGFAADANGWSALIHVRRCAGPVVLRDLRQSGLRQFGVMISDSRQVHVADSVLARAWATASSVVFERIVADPSSLSGLLVDGGEVDCARCSLRGGSGLIGGGGVELRAGRVRITRSTVEGTLVASEPLPAILTTAGEVHLDPTTTLRPARGAAEITGPATVVRRELTSLDAATDGATLRANLQGPANADFAIIASLPSASLPTPFGQLWLDPTIQVIADFGTLDGTRLHQWSVSYAPVIPIGFTLTMQAVVYNGTFELSMPTMLTFP